MIHDFHSSDLSDEETLLKLVSLQMLHFGVRSGLIRSMHAKLTLKMLEKVMNLEYFMPRSLLHRVTDKLFRKQLEFFLRLKNWLPDPLDFVSLTAQEIAPLCTTQFQQASNLGPQPSHASANNPDDSSNQHVANKALLEIIVSCYLSLFIFSFHLIFFVLCFPVEDFFVYFFSFFPPFSSS